MPPHRSRPASADPRRARRVPLAACVAAFALGAVALGACGSRGPLDDVIVIASADAADVGAPSTLDAASDADAAHDAASAPKDAGKDAAGEAGIIGCVGCVAQTCGQQFLQCFQDQTCRQTLQCVFTTCLAGGAGGGGGGGGFDPQCLFGCTKGDSKALASLLGIFQCLTQKCGSDCGGVLGGLGGGGFPGGGGGFPGGGGGRGGNGGRIDVGAAATQASDPAETRAFAREMMQTYPQLCE